MTYLDKLLQGVEVEWKSLGKIAELKRGKTITSKDKKDGNIPVISGGQKPAYYNAEYNRIGETITVAGSGAYAGHIMYWNEPIFVSDAFSVKPVQYFVNIKYLFYYLLKKQAWVYNLKKGAGIPHVYPKDLEKLHVPIPCPNNPEKSIEIQKEIVRILDTFTELTAELTAKLAAELTARKKKYNHYRDQLLCVGNEVEWKAFGEVTLPSSNIRWRDTDKSFQYIDLTSVCREKNAITETITITKNNAPRRAQKLVLSNDVIFATT